MPRLGRFGFSVGDLYESLPSNSSLPACAKTWAIYPNVKNLIYWDIRVLLEITVHSNYTDHNQFGGTPTAMPPSTPERSGVSSPFARWKPVGPVVLGGAGVGAFIVGVGADVGACVVGAGTLEFWSQCRI